MAGLCLILDSDKARRKLITSLLLSRALDIVLNLLIQNANTSEENQRRNETGKDKPSKSLILMIMFFAALISNLYLSFFEPELIPNNMMRVNLKWCMIENYTGIMKVWHL